MMLGVTKSLPHLRGLCVCVCMCVCVCVCLVVVLVDHYVVLVVFRKQFSLFWGFVVFLCWLFGCYLGVVWLLFGCCLGCISLVVRKCGSVCQRKNMNNINNIEDNKQKQRRKETKNT